MATEKELKTVIGRILKDIRIGIGDEFDQNFERQAFFTKAWARRRSPLRPGGHILIDTGALRKSISSRSDESSITFYSDLPYAAIHNEGGEIKVTARMKDTSGLNIMKHKAVLAGRKTASFATTRRTDSSERKLSSGKRWL